MDDLKEQMRENFLRYASYVILDRAIPHVIDGLKPVQRRLLYTLHLMDNGRLHKVANVAGQTMALHPHGDQPIVDALVHLANKNYLLDRQGNFGNIYTGDPAAAARYIETRLSLLARETLFDDGLTQFIPSYDGRQMEPVLLPAKIPLLLMQGAEGIAVGMATKILPHNFKELLEAEIALIRNKEILLVPDFVTGGSVDITDYNKGQGKVRVRARIDVKDDKTLLIREICFGTTTESLIASIDDAARKGKLKVDSIHDYSTELPEIEVRLPRGQHAHTLIDALFAFTECEVTIHCQPVVLMDGLPRIMDAHSVLAAHAQHLQACIKKELEIRRAELLEKIFQRTLEQIFIQEKLYKHLEEALAAHEVDSVIEVALIPFHEELSRAPTKEDRARLLEMPIRKISRYDLRQSVEAVQAMREELCLVEKKLGQIPLEAIIYLEGLLKKHGSSHPRRTQIVSMENIDKRAVEMKKVKLYFEEDKGLIGTKVNGTALFECHPLEKIAIYFKEGIYQVINLPEKHYLFTQEKTLIAVHPADKKTPMNVIYEHEGQWFIKRFIVEQFILEKRYPFIPEGAEVRWASMLEEDIELHFAPQPKQKQHSMRVKITDYPIKGVRAQGLRLTKKAVIRHNVINQQNNPI